VSRGVTRDDSEGNGRSLSPQQRDFWNSIAVTFWTLNKPSSLKTAAIYVSVAISSSWFSFQDESLPRCGGAFLFWWEPIASPRIALVRKTTPSANVSVVLSPQPRPSYEAGLFSTVGIVGDIWRGQALRPCTHQRADRSAGGPESESQLRNRRLELSEILYLGSWSRYWDPLARELA